MTTDVEALLARPYLTPDEVSEVIPSLTKSKLATWRHEGTGPRYRKAGKAVLYVLDDIVEWLESNVRPTPARKAR